MVRSACSFLVAVFVLCHCVTGVLRFPDAGYDMRWPIQLEHCDKDYPDGKVSSQPAGEYLACLQQLREHVRDDLDCTAITSNNSLYLLPAEISYIYTACDHFRLAFECVYALGSDNNGSLEERDQTFRQDWGDFVKLQMELFQEERVSDADRFIFANSSESIVQHHTELVVKDISAMYDGPDWRSALRVALAIAARLQFLIENLSMSLLVNFLLSNLERNSIVDGKDYVQEMYGDVRDRYVFHDHLGPKRWDVLCYLLDRLISESGSSSGAGLRMAEIGVDTANVSMRLLQRYSASALSLHVGVDPYRNKPGSTVGDVAHEATRSRLRTFGRRSKLLRMMSEDAAASLHDSEPFDIIFLDARHDHDSVLADIRAWWPLVRRPGGILCGHDFQWQYPGLPMAVTAGLREVPIQDGIMHLASDGMWWFDM